MTPIWEHLLRIRIVLIFTVGVLLASPVLAMPPTNADVIPLGYGINRIDITGHHLDSMAMLANRENFNAHGFDVLSIYIKSPSTITSTPIWSIVPVFDAEKERLVITVSGGADCYLHDFRLVKRAKGQPLSLVIASRELGESFGDPDVVTFTFYELRNNKTGEVGEPVYYFARMKSFSTKHKYCDVEEAFQKELGLKDYRDKSKR